VAVPISTSRGDDDDATVRAHSAGVGEKVPVAAHEHVAMHGGIGELHGIGNAAAGTAGVPRGDRLDATSTEGYGDARVDVLV
jgi:hypothetical protein